MCCFVGVVCCNVMLVCSCIVVLLCCLVVAVCCIVVSLCCCVVLLFFFFVVLCCCVVVWLRTGIPPEEWGGPSQEPMQRMGEAGEDDIVPRGGLYWEGQVEATVYMPPAAPPSSPKSAMPTLPPSDVLRASGAEGQRHVIAKFEHEFGTATMPCAHQPKHQGRALSNSAID